MKIFNIILPFGMILILLVSCKENIISKKSSKVDNLYNPDSIYYNIDITWNENGVEEELFLITRNIIVSDSIFGGYDNNENWKRAWKYMKKNYPETECPNFKYNIYMYENDKFNEFASIIYDGRDITYPSLRQGEFSNLNSNFLKGKYKDLSASNFLRIMEISNDDLDSRCINVIYNDKKWTIISKEILKHNYELKYCIDTTDNNFSLRNMYFNYIFDYPQSNFTCK